jgi:hypothetical protein
MSTIVAAYADGGVIQCNPSPIGGTWAACHVTADGARVWEASGVIPAGSFPISNNYAEYVAALRALEALPPGWSGRLYSDSRITLGRLCGEWWEGAIHHTQAICYSLNGLPADEIARGRSVLGRLGPFVGVLLQGHPTRADLARGVGAKRGFPVSIHNVWADDACNRTAHAYLTGRAFAQLRQEAIV